MRPATSDIGASSGNPPLDDVTVSYAMHTAPLATRSFACSGSGARCRYVKRIWPLRSIFRSTACGSLTLTIMSDAANTSAAEPTTLAPALRYASSSIPMPWPALCSTVTS